MMRTFIQVSAVVLTLGSSIFLIKGNLNLTPEVIVGLSLTRFGGNPEVMKNLCDQKGDTIVGFSILMLAFLLQLWNLLWPIRYKDFDVNRKGVLAALVVSIGMIRACNFLSQAIGNYHFQKASQIFDTSTK